MFRLTNENRQIVLDALAETGGNQSAATALLKSRGYNCSRGTVQRVAKQGNSEAHQLAKIAHLTAEVRSLRSKNSRLLQQLGARDEFHDNLLAAVTPITPQPPFKQSLLRGAPLVEMVWLFSDAHVGQAIHAAEVNNFNEYNYKIALARMRFLTDNIIKYASTIRSGYKLTSLSVICLGDNIHGEIHDEYVRTNEFTVPESIVRAAQLLAGGLAHLAPHFRTLDVHGLLCDNHGRSTRKPASASAARTSYNITLFALLKAYMQKHSNIRIHTYESARAHIRVQSHTFLCEHGDMVRSVLGTPIYGLTRADLAQAKRHLKQKESFDYHLWAHWHVPLIGPFGIVNGAFVGPDEYSTNRLPYSAVADASQWTFLVHPTHGCFNFVPWSLRYAHLTSNRKQTNKQ